MNEERIEEIPRLLNLILKYELKDLVRLDLGEKYNFKSKEIIFKSFQSDAKYFLKIDFSLVPFTINIFNEFMKILNKVNNIFSELKKVQINNDLISIHNNQSNLLERVLEEYLPVKVKMSALISLSFENKQKKYSAQVDLALKEVESHKSNFKVSLDSRMNELESSVIDFNKIKIAKESLLKQGMKIFHENLNENTLKLDQLILDQKNMASAKLLSKYGDQFEKKANSFKTQAIVSLTFSIALGIAILSVASFFIIALLSGDMTNINPYTLVASKIVIYSVLFLFLNFSIKSYKIAKHNKIVYENKHLALQTFEIFANTTDNLETRDIVLISANNLIYSEINTGYLNNDSSGGAHDKIFEIINKVSSK